MYIHGLVHEFMHEWILASLPAGGTPDRGDNFHISLLLYRIYTEWPDYYAFRDHNNLANQCLLQIFSQKKRSALREVSDL